MFNLLLFNVYGKFSVIKKSFSFSFIYMMNIHTFFLLGSQRADIPTPQRRGAIIILGMLAKAYKETIADNVDLLLRVGLGSFGAVRINDDDDVLFY
jgi:hypothetical protein